MTPEEQRIAIAEACGWKEIKVGRYGAEPFTEEYPIGVMSCIPTPAPETIPDYLKDLNTMHEAEKVLTEEQWHDYFNYVADLAVPNQLTKDIGFQRIICATAAQRAEAFLRAIGKWKE